MKSGSWQPTLRGAAFLAFIFYRGGLNSMYSDDKDRMHGEGDRESARKYNEAAHR